MNEIFGVTDDGAPMRDDPSKLSGLPVVGTGHPEQLPSTFDFQGLTRVEDVVEQAIGVLSKA